MLLKLVLGAVIVLGLSACGQPVEIPPGTIGKITGPDGYHDGFRQTSKFRLPVCLPGQQCDKLVLLDIADHAVKEEVSLLMPQDKLEMAFDLRVTLALKPDGYDHVFAKMPLTSTESSFLANIAWNNVYITYAQQILRTEAREFLSRYKIAEIMSSREGVNAELSAYLADSIMKKTPFIVRYVGLGDIKYPSIIVDAQNNAAERREKIAQEEAQLEVAKVTLERQLQEQQLQRKIDVEKANADAEINRILSESMTDGYIKYRQLAAIEKLAESENKVFIPVGMLDSIAAQVALGK